MIKLRDISFSYEHVRLFSEVSMEINRGELVGLVGENGVGKTTLMDIIAGVKRSSFGTIELDMMQSQLAYCRQSPSLPARSKVKEVFDLILYLNAPQQSRSFFVKTLPKLMQEKWYRIENKLVGVLSGGERRLLSVIAMFALKRSFLLLDEPMAGLDATSRDLVWQCLEGFQHRNESSCLITSHIESEIFNHCNKVYALKDARLVRVK